MGKQTKHKIRVYYEDTDVLGMVYYANYLKYLERGRSEHVRSFGYNQNDIANELNVVFSVRRIEVDYVRPAVFEQELEVISEIVNIRGARLFFDQKIICSKTKEVHCKAAVEIACMDSATHKPTRLPEKFLLEITNG